MEKRSAERDFIEITSRTRSFAFLNLQASVSHIHDLASGIDLYNEFAHLMGPDPFLRFASRKYEEEVGLTHDRGDLKEYVFRRDLGRNMWFFNKLAFLHLVNAFIIYCSDILTVAVLGSPEKFSLSIKLGSARIGTGKSANQLRRDLEIALISKIVSMAYPELKKSLFSKIRLSAANKKRLAFIDKAVSKRHEMTHGLGIANWAISIYETGGLRKREKVTDAQLRLLWKSMAELARAIDIAVMREFDIWRGVDICAPGLYRREGGQLIRAREEGAYEGAP